MIAWSGVSKKNSSKRINILILWPSDPRVDFMLKFLCKILPNAQSNLQVCLRRIYACNRVYLIDDFLM